MNHLHHVGPCFVRLAVDEKFEKQRASLFDANAQPGRNAHFALDVIALDPNA